MYVYRKQSEHFSLIPKGFRKIKRLPFYKHKFPSGMWDKLDVRHKADNSEI
jgi:hypothetical protein